MKKISILGCGWLGFPLAKSLLNKGNKVKGSTTSSEKLKDLNAVNIISYEIILSENRVKGDIENFLKHSDLLIVNIPPRLRKNPKGNHVAEIENLIPYIEKSEIKQVIFISSTSVFKDENHFPEIKQDSKPNAISGIAQQLQAVENLLQESKNFKTSIIRCSGLFDEHRHPGYFLSGRSNILNPKAPINLIHKNDVISIIISMIKLNKFPYQFNLSYPYHPSKKLYYTAFCKSKNLPLPKFQETQQSQGKIIDSEFVERLLNHSWQIKP